MPRRVRHLAGDRVVVAAAAAVALLLVTAICATPVLESGAPGLAAAVRAGLSPVCHQLPERSLHLDGVPLAVCARCAGLYLGGLAGLWLGLAGLGRATPLRSRPRWFFAGVAPTVVDASLAWAGAPSLSEVPRMLLALPAGAVAGVFLAVALADLVRSRARTFTRVRRPLVPTSEESHG